MRTSGMSPLHRGKFDIKVAYHVQEDGRRLLEVGTDCEDMLSAFPEHSTITFKDAVEWMNPPNKESLLALLQSVDEQQSEKAATEAEPAGVASDRLEEDGNQAQPMPGSSLRLQSFVTLVWLPLALVVAGLACLLFRWVS
ncbi:Uu.00g094640.m01.CDS01 [Anthostomella pinea]|uniref:Uu.00g094640.m01.CDS01 n=1 Tax=Anthostomella pinea TaxID=933095 RepID=A0AAI8VNS3_9PEZI|nr:Uu.00g094640.m01.CDS01 [Anthostomella pinea]